MKKLIILSFMALLFCLPVISQKRILNVPDLPGYVTLKCDLHMHTVFSDGNVWPTIRIDEAVRDGLDAISITDHLEYLPHRKYIPTDHNASWKISESYARERNIILVHGAEITRSMPPGHFNALFIKDANLLALDSAWNVFEAAVKQGAFLMYNHPGWERQQPDSIPRMYDIHRRLLKNGWLHGVELYNGAYYPLVLEWCRKNNLTAMASSDEHGMISENTIRPMTFVFAKERTHDALREALFAGRTLIWFSDKLAGKEEYAKPFFYQCITVGKPYYQNEKSVYFEIYNKSDIPFSLSGRKGAPSINLAPNSITRVIAGRNVTLPMEFDVSNVMTGEKEFLKVEIQY